jgi:hypothetical protein
MAFGGALTVSCSSTTSPAGGTSTSSGTTGTATSTRTETETETDTDTDTDTDTHTSLPMTQTATSIFSAYGAAPDCDGLVTIPDGGVAAPGACSDHEYVFVPLPSVCFGLLDCALMVDSGTTGDYALCADGSFSVCTGYPPSDGGWVQVDLPEAGDAGNER